MSKGPVGLSPNSDHVTSLNGRSENSCEHRGKIARGNDPRGFVAVERKQAALAARDEIVGVARFGQGQKIVIVGIGRAFNVRQGTNGLGKTLDLVDEAAGLIWLDALGQSWLLKRGSQLVKMLRARQEREISFLPGAIDCGWIARLDHKRRYQNIDIEHHAHQTLSAFPLA